MIRNPDAAPEKTTVNGRMSEKFLEDIDMAWPDLGYNRRSEFIRDVLIVRVWERIEAGPLLR